MSDASSSRDQFDYLIKINISPFARDIHRHEKVKMCKRSRYAHKTCVGLIVILRPRLTCLRVRRAVYLRSLPSRRNSGWGLSRIINTISDGIFPFDWSPSFWNVTFVPDFQPGFTEMLTYLSSFLGVPSGCSTRLDIFIFFTQPVLISSRVTYKSCSTAGSWIFSFLTGVWTLNECDLKKTHIFSFKARNITQAVQIAIIKFHVVSPPENLFLSTSNLTIAC